jgi:hypothetical protein
MADHTAIAAVSRTLRTLLLDRMVVSPVTVTFVSPEVSPDGVDGARVNIYLTQVMENPELKNQEIPGHGYPGAYGKPPLSLNLRYLVTTYTQQETQPEADLNAQITLGDVMRVMHDFANRLDTLPISNPAVGVVGDPILDQVLRNEYERIKLTLHPATIDDLTKIWSAMPEANFRRSVIYEATVVQIETPEPRARPRPVEERRIIAAVLRRPVIRAAYVTPSNGPPKIPLGEQRVCIGEEITIETEPTGTDPLFVRLGTVEPIRVQSAGDGFIRLTVPDTSFTDAFGVVHAIPASQQLQPGPLEVQLIVEHPVDAVSGGLGQGASTTITRRYASAITLMQLVPHVATSTPANGPKTTVLHITGTRLWNPNAKSAEVIVGDAAVTIRAPAPGDPWAAPTPTAIEVLVSNASPALDPLPAGPPPYPVWVEIDGARSREAAGFHLDP